MNDRTLMEWIRTKQPVDRHYAVVVYPQTVELRIFRGTLSPFGFWKDLEFCKALYDFSKKGGIYSMIRNDFVRFVLKQGNKFRRLRQFMEKHSMTRQITAG